VLVMRCSALSHVIPSPFVTDKIPPPPLPSFTSSLPPATAPSCTTLHVRLSPRESRTQSAMPGAPPSSKQHSSSSMRALTRCASILRAGRPYTTSRHSASSRASSLTSSHARPSPAPARPTKSRRRRRRRHLHRSTKQRPRRPSRQMSPQRSREMQAMRMRRRVPRRWTYRPWKQQCVPRQRPSSA